MQPYNAQLLKLKGDILKDLGNMPEAEKVCSPANSAGNITQLLFNRRITRRR